MLFRRDRESAAPAAAPDATEPRPAGTGPGGKGRPTPTRKQAQTERQARVRPPLDRRAERRRRREQLAAQRAQTRQAMETGDERYFMNRDRGPVRRFVRDFVDGRRTAAEYFLPAIVLVFVLSLMPSLSVRAFASLLMILVLLIVIFDSTLIGFRLKSQIRSRFPDDHGRGHVLYGIARASQLRRFRLPKPQVRPGGASISRG